MVCFLNDLFLAEGRRCKQIKNQEKAIKKQKICQKYNQSTGFFLFI